jgi:excisionase family DNA binding protein
VPDPNADEWLTLAEASELLGVHVSTLRRWSNTGRLPSRRTAGGHRRFNRRQLEAQLRHAAPDSVAMAEEAQSQAWFAQFEAAGRVDALRELGQRLSGIVVQYLLRADEDRRHLGEGHDLGEAYAAHTRAAGLRLSVAVAAFLYYRSHFNDIVRQLPADGPGAIHRLYARYDRLMGEVLLGLIAGYERDAGA